MLRLIVAGLCLLQLILLAASQSRCSSIRSRQEIRQLSSQQRIDLYNAVKQLNSGPRPTEWDRLSNIHISFNHRIHEHPVFLPWHRHFLVDLERRLRRINSNIVLPYWDSSLDADNPAGSVIFSGSNSWLGGQGSCVSNGAFANFTTYYTDNGPREHCMNRRFDRGNSISPFYRPSINRRIIQEQTTYNGFREAIEFGPHGVVHNGIGGDMMDMCAPNDLLFYLHHAFMDKLWNDWQRTGNNLRKYDMAGTSNPRAVSLSDRLPSYNTAVSATLNVREDYCYDYAPSPQGAASKTTPHPQVQYMSEEYIARMGYDKNAVRRIESYLHGMVDDDN
ncbi:hypothetical protein H4R35_004362 [Dimargaris xerosporica]|nr:hypothetical protein H4R35_004362 [Dimargaris xerosporica]